MKLRASLLFRPDVARTPAAHAEVSRFLEERGVSVLRVGRQAVSVEAESADLAAALDAPVVDSTDQRLLLKSRSLAGEWFNAIEVVPPALLFEGRRSF